MAAFLDYLEEVGLQQPLVRQLREEEREKRRIFLALGFSRA